MKKVKYLLLTKSIGLYLNLLVFVLPEKAFELAFKLFSNPRAGRLSPENLPPILHGNQTETLFYNDQHFPAYKWNGNDKTVLLVHGWESNASRWEQLIPHLQKSGYTIIAIDAPAHGLASGAEFSVPAYAEFINVAVEKFKPKYLIGHSIGGAACVYFQSQYQHPSLEKMILLGAPSDLKTLIANFGLILSLNSKMVSSLENHFMEKLQFKIEEFSGKHFGKKLKLKGMIAHDIDDNVVAFEEGRKIAGSWENSVFVETKGLGHSMHDAELYRKNC
ncbi:alpha/beta hydrolase [Flavobacterium sp. 3HN19-14]|uniref:alpha/beta hydrolase n=1 Tax=Flavobacterium sp. 3HN19-14 TaxID=3448133 RepID=UPI003EDEDD02